MFDKFDAFCCGIMIGMIGCAFLIGWLNTPNAREYREQAIQHGFAQHNPKTGEWEWIVPSPPTPSADGGSE